MFYECLKAIFLAGIPVGTFSFLMIYMAYSKGYLSLDVDIEHAFNTHKNKGATLSKQHKKELTFLHSKWVTFGGGFYGLIAVLTFVVIELTQITQFWLGVEGWNDISALFTVSTLISMFIDSILNMIKAVVWFTYWPNILPAGNFIFWMLVAYIGYRFGAKLAKKHVIKKNEMTD